MEKIQTQERLQCTVCFKPIKATMQHKRINDNNLCSRDCMDEYIRQNNIFIRATDNFKKDYPVAQGSSGFVYRSNEEGQYEMQLED